MVETLHGIVSNSTGRIPFVAPSGFSLSPRPWREKPAERPTNPAPRPHKSDCLGPHVASSNDFSDCMIPRSVLY